jgi:hypothetical protein
MKLDKEQMAAFKVPVNVPDAVMWECAYYWPGLGVRRTLHQPSYVEDVVHSLADDPIHAFEINPIDAMGRVIKVVEYADPAKD